MNQLKSIYNKQFKDSHSHPIHTYFLIIASNVRLCLNGNVQILLTVLSFIHYKPGSCLNQGPCWLRVVHSQDIHQIMP